MTKNAHKITTLFERRAVYRTKQNTMLNSSISHRIKLYHERRYRNHMQRKQYLSAHAIRNDINFSARRHWWGIGDSMQLSDLEKIAMLSDEHWLRRV